MEEFIDSLGQAMVFATFDTNPGFWHVEVAKPDQNKTAFALHHRPYLLTRMPFELRSTPAPFNVQWTLYHPKSNANLSSYTETTKGSSQD